MSRQAPYSASESQQSLDVNSCNNEARTQVPETKHNSGNGTIEVKNGNNGN